MTDPEAHDVDPADEGRHPAGPEPLWNESVYLDFVAADGSLGGYARIGLYPNLGVTWWTATVVRPGAPTLSSTAYDLPVAGGTGLALGAGGIDLEVRVEAPLERVRVAGTAPALALERPADAYLAGAGTPASLAVDLTWETDGVPYHYDITTRYEIPCLVGGTVTIDGVTHAIEGEGQRDHSWGVRDWWAFGWCWFAGRLEDGTRVHGADIRLPGSPMAFGYVQHPWGDVVPVTGLEVREETDADGLATSATITMAPSGITMEVAPAAWGPVLLTGPDGRASRFPRAMVELTADDGRRGRGWIEWNQPQSAGPEGAPGEG
jgi:hypothetical protein